MGTRVPVQPYNLRSANSYIGGSLHDLNTVDGRPGEIDGHVDRDTEDGLDNDEESSAVDCIHEPYRSSLPLHGVGEEEDCSTLENNGSSRSPYDILTTDDVSPIENTRARFLDIVVDHFVNSHVIEVPDTEADYTAQSTQDKLSKRKLREMHYEGDSRFVLPLMYVANMYETLVNEVNIRLSSLNGFRGKTIGVALEAAGGLYRKLAKKFPRKGTCIFKRRELATSLETRTRFPELVIQEEKRVRFVVVNGLAIVEKPTNMRIDDAEWFKRLTGRNEVGVSATDYKFYSPRHKYRRVTSNSVPGIPGLPITLLQWLLAKVTTLSTKHRISSKHHPNIICNQFHISLSIILCTTTISILFTKLHMQLTFLTTTSVDQLRTCLKFLMLSSLQSFPSTWLAYNRSQEAIWEGACMFCLVQQSFVMNVELHI
ncbi:uncharacterized protein At2g02148 isoform X2 [Actinidia eriantha]|uniref:uncharacterized protein At2g02148 isoform X2 n=1 Tax=Actinidia eriantha TaxID=165200 RepID=UPI00258D6878|nr:uncharacterized protein At2g02148 isoform X2 [Actinidia eriantha]